LVFYQPVKKRALFSLAKDDFKGQEAIDTLL